MVRPESDRLSEKRGRHLADHIRPARRLCPPAAAAPGLAGAGSYSRVALGQAGAGAGSSRNRPLRRAGGTGVLRVGDARYRAAFQCPPPGAGGDTARPTDDPAHGRLVEALEWVDGAFVGDPLDVRDWPVLDPLAPHARAVATFADEAGVPGRSARLLSDVGLLLFRRALYTEAEPLMRRALAIDEASLGADHPEVAIRLNNLAQLLQATNRLAEAEPLMRRALAIDETSFGPITPTSPATSTTWRSCSRPPTGWPRPSR